MPLRTVMAESVGKMLEGVFAVNKPPSLSSAQILRDLQGVFATSRTFAPLLDDTKSKIYETRRDNKRRRVDASNVFKMGHGGTLDPLATGVLIVGIGRGTKHLQGFLDCTKTYETVVLFGKATDTYDIAGKIVATKDTSQITKALVEEKLSAFRGDIKQVPPIYSALKIDGVKAYDYARAGKPLPRELPARDMNVTECELVEWYDPGQHEFRWPASEATAEDKNTFQQFMGAGDSQAVTTSIEKLEEQSSIQTDTKLGQKPSRRAMNNMSSEEKAALHTHDLVNLSAEIANAPAARIRLTVSSGFYVRSFAHDLGIACDSYATMAELARTRQAEYTSKDSEAKNTVPAIDHASFLQGEEAWQSHMVSVLENWVTQNPAPEGSDASRRDSHRSKYSQRRQSHGRQGNRDPQYRSRPKAGYRPHYSFKEGEFEHKDT